MKNLKALFTLLISLVSYVYLPAQPIQNFQSVEEIEAYKRQIVNNRTDRGNEHINQPFYNPESGLDLELQLFAELSSISGLSAVESDGDYIYVGTWNDVIINKYDLSGNFIESFIISGAGHYRDFAWDGNYLYATDGSSFVYEIDLASQSLNRTIITSHLLRGIAYNDDTDVFYGSNLSNPIVEFDRNGNTLAQYSLGTYSGLYGLAYDNLSPDGPFLWGFSQPSTIFVQYNAPDITETGNTFSVSDDLGLPETVAGGLALTENISPGTFSLLGILQSEAIIAYNAGQTVSFDNDVAVLSILSPTTGVNLTGSEPVTIKVRNYGTNPQSDIPVTFTLDGGETFTGTVAGTLQPGESIEYTFDQSVDLSTPEQTYTIEACTNLQNDEFTDNDCKTKQVTHEIPFYCIPFSSCSFGDGFESFTLETIENLNSGCSPNGYGDFTDMFTELQAGETYTITWSSGYGQNLASLWIDLDQDIVFDDEERLITNFSLDTSNVVYEAEITIPLDAPEGETILRIRANWLQSSSDPCEEFYYGETEDYTVIISNTPLAKNVGIKSIDIPPVAETGAFAPQATIRNYGIEAQSFPVELVIGNYASTKQISALEPGAEVVVDFDVWNAEPGQYEASACTQLEGDEFTQNDCEAKELIVINPVSAYGFVSYDPAGQLDNSWVAFDISNPGALLQVGTTNLLNPIVGATYASDKIYGVDYIGNIYEFDPATGTQELLWDNNPQYFGIAFDGTDFYVNTYDKLYKFDMATGEATLIGSFANSQFGIISIAFGGNGELWGVDLATDELLFINKETAEATVIGPLGQDFIYLCDLSFDKASNVLYFAGSQNFASGLSEIYIIDIETGNASPVGQLQNNVHIYALTITSESSFMFPPGNLSAAVSGNDAILTWDEPFGGNVVGYNVYRDDDLIETTTETEFTDESLEIGLYSYTVTALYDDGESDPAGPVEVVIGNPEIAFAPESIDAVLELGEATVTQFILYNEGNLDLNFDLTAYFNPQTSLNPAPQPVSKEEFDRRATERFGENWQELYREDEMISAPQGIDAYCSVSGNCSLDDGITNFKLGEINNLNSGCSSDGYGDFTSQSTSLDAGMPYEIIASSGYHNNYLSVWVDLNQNEIFEENEKVLEGLNLEMAGELYTAQIIIPQDALPGETRLRAVASWVNPEAEPCGYTGFGEAEDYTVNIGSVASWISLEPESGSIVPGDSTVVNVTLDADGLDPIEYMGSIEIASNDSSNLTAEIPANLTVIEQGISNFFPVWETPFNPMSVFVVGATLDSLDLNLGDEIGVFDIDPNSGEEICVGAGLVINPITPENILEITVSMDDGSNPDVANGFTPGNEMIFKLWNSLTGVVDDVTVTFPDPGFDEVFTPLGTAIVELDGSALITQPLNLSEGWNLISSRAQPHNTNMMTVFQPMINMNVLQKVIDEDGGTMIYLPYPEPEGRWNNSIGEMEMAEGYYVKVNQNIQTSMYGLPVELPMDMPLEAGWNIMGYPAEIPQEALEVVDPLITENNLYKVIDQSGGVIQFLPFPEPNGTWINTIGDFENGQGYYIKVYNETSLIIDETPGTKSVSNFKGGSAITEYFEPVYQNNPYMPMHFILYANGNLEAGDEIGIFDGDVCVGASVYDGNTNNMTITVTSMDDPDTEAPDGYTSGNDFEVKIWKAGSLYEDVEVENMSGPETFTPLESYIGNITETITAVGDRPTTNALKVFPNPASDAFRINLSTDQATEVSIGLYRMDGTLVRLLYDGELAAGNQTFDADVNGLAPGLYLIKATLQGTSGAGIYEKIVIQ